jgi:uncharacterized protein (TIGR04255 family)
MPKVERSLSSDMDAQADSEPRGAMSGQWEPVHKAHAIEVVGASVAFSEPLPDVLFKKVLRAAEAPADAAGLRGRMAVFNEFDVEMGMEGTRRFSPAKSTPGLSFRRMEPTGIDLPQNRATEELVVERQAFTYRTFEYIRWGGFKRSLIALFRPPLAVALDAVAVQHIRLEYRDRFFFDGPPQDAAPGALLRQGSEWISPHIFRRADAWHAHTGAFEPSEGAEQRLILIVIDATEMMPVGRPDGSRMRSVTIMTAGQDNFAVANAEADVQSADTFFGRLDSVHTLLKSLLSNILCDDMIDRIGLTLEDEGGTNG